MKRTYAFEIFVSNADELVGMSEKLSKFMREFGEPEEVNVNVSIDKTEPCVNTHAIGFGICSDEDYNILEVENNGRRS